jgi:hypothetical protein
MRKSDGSPRVRRPEVDPLEGRLLLSHPAHPTTDHAGPVTPVQVLPPPAASRPETSAALTETVLREAEEVAAASVESKETYSIPLITLGKSAIRTDDPPGASQDPSESNRNLRLTFRDEPVAWATEAGGSLVAPRSRYRADATRPSLEFAVEPRLGGILKPGAEAGKVEGMPEPRGSDLLDHFLPADRATLEQLIDSLLDGFDGSAADQPGGVEASSLIPSPILWGIAIVSLEMGRRRLRRLAGDEDGHDPDRDPAVGILGPLE